ncbi:MAG: thiamine phosphate synthase [Tannerellaceae bacterium]|jgi:thiamine-phosphate pyrophosphorylase|nr:thiamine phosphate synthase [Tannerellaceae bacterium]
MQNKFPYRLYLVLSENNCPKGNFMDVAEQAIAGGVDIIQLREKTADTVQFLDKALRLQDRLSKCQVPLIINDNLDIALQSSAYGIHVGNNDISPQYIRSVWKDCSSLGYSIEYLEQLKNNDTQVSDCLGISPVFQTSTKKDTVTEWGIQGVNEIRSRTDKPLIAIGNMNAENVYEVIKAGADCIAVISAICSADNPAKAAFKIRNQIEKAL